MAKPIPQDPNAYIRAFRGKFHLRSSTLPENDWWSYNRSRCGWKNDLGRSRVPGFLPESFEVCRKCLKIESE